MLLTFRQDVTRLVMCLELICRTLLQQLNGDNTVYAKVNHKHSELSLTYNFLYNDHRGLRSLETADYTLNNGSHYLVSRNQTAGRSRHFGNQFEIKYCLADSATYVFQASLSTDGSNTPGNYADYTYRDGVREQAFRTIGCGQLASLLA